MAAVRRRLEVLERHHPPASPSRPSLVKQAALYMTLNSSDGSTRSPELSKSKRKGPLHRPPKRSAVHDPPAEHLHKRRLLPKAELAFHLHLLLVRWLHQQFSTEPRHRRALAHRPCCDPCLALVPIANHQADLLRA